MQEQAFFSHREFIRIYSAIAEPYLEVNLCKKEGEPAVIERSVLVMLQS